MSPQGQGHTSVNILHYWKKAYWNFILTAFEGVCTGINPEIGILKFFKYDFEIRVRTIDIALSVDLNDRVQGILNVLVP